MKKQTKRCFLLVSSDALSSQKIEKALRIRYSESFELIHVKQFQKAAERSKYGQVDLILLDVSDTSSPQLDLIEKAKQQLGNIPILALSPTDSRMIGIEAVKRGAYDCIPKDRITPEAISRVVQYCLERHRRIALEQEMINAAEIQQSLLPALAPDYEGVDVACFLSAASHSCGDYLDHFVLPSGRIAMVIGDVSGHGLPAALKMIELRTMIRSLATENDQISTIASEMNSYLLSKSASIGNGASQFITLFMVAFDPGDQSFDYVGAGHSGMLQRANGQLEELTSTGFPLGIIETEFDQRSVTTNTGDLLFIGSDGLHEAPGKGGDRFGISRIKNLLRTEGSLNVHLILKRLMEKFHEFQNGEPQEDDISILIAKSAIQTHDQSDNLRVVLEATKRSRPLTQTMELTPCD